MTSLSSRLLHSVQYDTVKEVAELLDQGADLNEGNGSKFGTPLHYAIRDKREDIAFLLLERGADFSATSHRSGSVLSAAVEDGTLALVTKMLDLGADVNQVFEGNDDLYPTLYPTPLRAAAGRGDPKLISFLVEKGAKVDLVNGLYGTALGYAVLHGRTAAVSSLLDAGADVQIAAGQMGSGLSLAAYYGNIPMLLLLLGRGADINMVSEPYGTALTTAICRAHGQVASLLLERGADPNAGGGKYESPLIAAVAMDLVWFRGHPGWYMNNNSKGFGAMNSVALVNLLLDGKADINLVTKNGNTALGIAMERACGYEKPQIVRLLLDRGADPNIVCGKHGSILGQAIHRGNAEDVDMLLKYGADVMRVGGFHETALGVYPTAFDVAKSSTSNADSALIQAMSDAVQGHIHMNDVNHCEANIDLFLPPFPMPYSGPCCAISTARNQDDTNFSSASRSFGGAGARSITPELADIPCAKFDETELIHLLIDLTGLEVDTANLSYAWMQQDIKYFVARQFDFGLAYAAFRVAWKHLKNEQAMGTRPEDISMLRAQWHYHAVQVDAARANVIQSTDSGQEIIESPYSVMPRRIWDVKSNRVVDFRMLQAALSSTHSPLTFWALSHSWTDDMYSVNTSINMNQWPVPLPKGIELSVLRDELLDFGAEYLWLDVLCLRQHSQDNFEIRQKEWKLDVPTIGNIYRAATRIVRYFNGLGKSFSKKDWDDPRHWLQRAWTLQEIANEHLTINGGVSAERGRVLMNTLGTIKGEPTTLRRALRPVLRLAAEVSNLRGCPVYDLAREMANRHSTSPVDKLSGLFYLLQTTKLPCYDAKLSSEDFWKQCFHLLPLGRKMEILFDFPYRGSQEQWFPTWANILDWPERDPNYDHGRTFELSELSATAITSSALKEASFPVPGLWSVSGVVLRSTEDPSEYEVKIGDKLFGFYCPYTSQQPIQTKLGDLELNFTLVVSEPRQEYNWVVCEFIEQREAMTDEKGGGVGDAQVNIINVLRKVGVLRTDSCSELLIERINGTGELVLQQVDCLFV